MPRVYVPQLGGMIEYDEGMTEDQAIAEIQEAQRESMINEIDTPEPAVPTPTKEDGGGLIDTLTGFATGVGQSMPQTKAAEAIAGSIIKLMGGDKTKAQEFKDKAPTAHGVGETVGTIAQYAAGSAGLKAIPQLASSKLLPTMIRGAIANPVVTQMQDFDPSLKRVGIDALWGAGGEAGGKLIQAVGKSPMLRGFVRKWMESAFPKNILSKIKQNKMYDVIGEMLERRLKGAPEKIKGRAQGAVDYLESQIDEIIGANKDLPAPKGKVVNKLYGLADDLAKEESRVAEAGKIRRMAEGYWKRGKTTLGDIQESKRRLYGLNKPKYEKGMQVDLQPARTQYEMTKASAQKELIEDVLAEQGIDISGLNKEQGLFLTIRDLMESVAKAEAGKGTKIGLRDLGLAGIGGAAGGAPTAMTLPIMARMLGGFAGRTKTASALNQLLKFMSQSGGNVRLAAPVGSTITQAGE